MKKQKDFLNNIKSSLFKHKFTTYKQKKKIIAAFVASMLECSKNMIRIEMQAKAHV